MSIFALISLLLTTAAMFGWVSARWLRLPQTIGSMGLTVSASLLLIALGGVAPGLHALALSAVGKIDLGDLILHGMLGLLLFAGAFLLDLDALARQRLAVGMLSVFATLLSTAGVAAGMHLLLPWLGLGVPWAECLLFGALISPTDPIAVLEMLGRAGVSPEVEAQLAGESLFNDGIGAVLFLTLLGIAGGHAPTPGHVAALLLVQAGGALLLGIGLARATSELMRRVERDQVEILLTAALALGGYVLAETLHLSAPLEAVAAGLAIRHFNAEHPRNEIAHRTLKLFWTLTDEMQNALLFVLLGVEVLAVAFSRRTLAAGVAAIVIVVLVRTGSVVAVVGALRALKRDFRTSLLALSWGGLRGGLSIALALTIPDALGRNWILAATYLVVVFSVLVQGGTLARIMRGRRS